MFALATATAAAVGCADDTSPGPAQDTGVDAMANPDVIVVPVYGAPPDTGTTVDMGSDVLDSGVLDSGGTQAIYGAPADVGGWETAADGARSDGVSDAATDTRAADGDAADASDAADAARQPPDLGGAMPVYGAPPPVSRN